MRVGAACDIARAPRQGVTQRTDTTAVRKDLRTADGVRIEARYEPYAGPDTGSATAGDPGAIVLAHGFTGSLDRPAVRRAATAFTAHAAVVTFSFRGHGRSGGRSTVGDREVLDLAAAVAWARAQGHRTVATVGFSMGGSVVLRHAALCRAEYGRGHAESTFDSVMHRGRTDGRTAAPASPRDAADAAAATPAPAHADAPVHTDAHAPAPAPAHADAVVAVSAPARWYYRGTAPMRRLHWAIQHPLGRLVSRYGLRTRVHHRDWDPVPLPPVAAVPRIAPVPLLVVHGDQDPYFPVDHPLSLAEAADPEACELWLRPGFGHAENAADAALLDRIGTWAATRLRAPAARPHHGTRDPHAPRAAGSTPGHAPGPAPDATEGTDG
ncbi:alpha/beta fold hydrolase [Streptomyces qinglanensis]|uniref:Alpha/beta hydrolase fold n=1 Tax=Streptomyces qinglanensis TaxID=943816 RepID=A0A1H9WJZ3_9ACTN|nr:alpha/beta hydrolase [Streptomyces qinglanensis]SES33987.1 alpha/beta hydrolase fold [Streptomyces qinglanensis]